MGGYLVCEECGGYYELQPGELPTDFTNQCECGGKLKYMETLESSDKNIIEEMAATTICPHCGAENPEEAKLCKSCKRILRMPSKSSVAYPKKHSTEGIFETWNKQSNGLKALSLIGVCCVGLILIAGISAMLSPDKNTQNNLSQSPTSTTPTSAAMSETDYASKAASWSGTVGDAITSAGTDMSSYANGGMITQEIVSALQGYKSTIDEVIKEQNAITPPTKYATVHQQTISAEQDASNALGYAITGAQTNNTADVDKGTNLMNSANSKFQQIKTELDQM